MARNCTLQESVNDDTIQCLFFSRELGSNTSWDDLCQQLNVFIKAITKDYIWHRDELFVYVPLEKVSDSTETPYHLCSTTCFGDNLEDEWFIVYVILEISKQFTDLIIQLKDNDGDFLLIEAANHLQSWANPETTENRFLAGSFRRWNTATICHHQSKVLEKVYLKYKPFDIDLSLKKVFIYKNYVHIIPPELVELETDLQLEEALNIVNEKPELTEAPAEIQQSILNRIGNYPKKISEQMHRAVVKLPSTIATLLTLKPSLVAPIVNAYCNRDIIDIKCCKNIEFNDCIVVEVKFTQFLYAALKHSKAMNCAKQYIKMEDVKEEIGLKLTCGFHIIMNNASVDDPFSSKEYHKFLNNLKDNSYFRNNIEGSKEYSNLLQKAQHYFSSVERPTNSNMYLTITDLMISDDFKRVKDSLKTASAKQFMNSENNEDWLNIQPEQLNEILHTRYGKTSKLKNNDIVTPQTITQELSSFLKQNSDYEGIELGSNEQSEPDNIDFQSDEFVSCIEKMLNILSTGCKEDSESIDSDGDFDAYNESDNMDDDDCDIELKSKLHNDVSDNLKDKTVLSNLIQSIKEEKASAGPSSNLMRAVGVSKTELLDSDDDIA